MNKSNKSQYIAINNFNYSKILMLSATLSGLSFSLAHGANNDGKTILPTVTVEATRSGSGSYKADNSSVSGKIAAPLLDTPKSVTVISRKLLDDKNITTMRDALRNSPGISLGAGEASVQGDSLTIRGFTARSDFFLDGMRDFGSYYRDPFNMDSIEVLEGPDSILFGRGSTGGVVNQVSKKPKLRSFNDATLNVGTDNTKRVTADVNKKLATNSALRLNIMGHNSNVAGRDSAENTRYGFAPSLALGLGTKTRLNISYFYQHEDNIPDYGIPWFFEKPAKVNKKNYYGFENTNFLKTTANIGTIKLEHDFNESFTLRQQLRYAQYDRNVQVSEARIPSNITRSTPLSDIAVTRNQIARNSVETLASSQTDLTSKFQTATLHHTLVTGIELSRETSKPKQINFTGVPSTSLVSPNSDQAFAGVGTVSSRVESTANTMAVYFVDTINLTKQWDLIGGLRYDHVDSEYHQSVTPVANFSGTDEMLSWRGGIVFKPLPIGSIYFSAGTSFNPSIENLTLAANNANLDPEKSKTYEVGTKWSLLQKRLNADFAIFRDEKTNARVTDPNNAALEVLEGKQRVDGFLVKLSGQLTKQWQAMAGYTYMDSEVLKATLKYQEGLPLGNAPRHTLTFWNSYMLPFKLEVGAGMNAISQRLASTTRDATTNVLKTAPGYVTFDAMVKYPVVKGVSVQLNVYNLTNKYYYDQLHHAHVVPGPGRTALLSTVLSF